MIIQNQIIVGVVHHAIRQHQCRNLQVQIVLSVDAITPPLSGIGRYTWELATRLPISPSIDDVRFYRQRQWITDPAILLKDSHPAKRRSWLQRKEPRWSHELRLKWACRGAIFHGPNYFLPECTDIGVATIHDLSIFRFPETHPVERLRHFELNFSRSLQRATHLITDTETVRREVVNSYSWPSERITAVPLGVSGLFRPRSFAETAAVVRGCNLEPGGYTLCVSTIEPRKKIDRLLTAYGRLPGTLRARYPLLLLGSEGWNSEGLHQQIERSCAEGWLKYQGFVPEADLPALYAGARLFVYPSLYEGFGLPVLEAMASGVPVVTSLDPALTEVSGGASLAVEPDDEDALLLAVIRGLEDEEWRGEASSKGLQVASKFTWERCVEQTAAVYKKVM
jgi:alpha-1,3-rhamnosyl/mannosyltransferase